MRLPLLCLALTIFAAAAQPCTPPAPQNVQCTPQPCYVEVRWSSVFQAERYEVYRRGPGNEEELIASPRYSPYQDVTAIADGAFYSVRAVAACGEGLRSAETYAAPNPGSLNPINGLEYDYWASLSCEQISISWNPFGGTYLAVQRIWRSPDANFAHAAVIGSATHYQSGYADSSGTPGVPYWYWVDRNLGPCSAPPVGPVTGRIRLLDFAPAELVATEGTICRAILVSWYYFSCANSPEVWRSPTPNLADAALINTTGPFYDTTAEEGVPYWYWVRYLTPQQTGPFAGPVRGFRDDEVTPSVTVPAEAAAIPGGTANIETLELGGAQPTEFSFQWRRNGEAIIDTDRVFGARTAALTITDAQASDEDFYDVVVSSPCGRTISSPVRLSVGHAGCPPFIADYNNDGGVDGSDVEAFYTDWEAGAFCADANQDGGIDGGDVEAFFICWERC